MEQRVDSKKNKDNLVWIDMEMTGLEIEKERIIEIASIITDKNLNILEEGPNLVIHQPRKILKAMDSWNQNHHKKSGLLDSVIKSKITTKKAEKRTLDFLKKYCIPGKCLLAGNAVHHDRRFIAEYMPKLDRFLHYRHVDVTSLKVLIKWWYPKGKNEFKKKDAHRALDDIRESIEELKYYREHFFK